MVNRKSKAIIKMGENTVKSKSLKKPSSLTTGTELASGNDTDYTASLTGFASFSSEPSRRQLN